ncbi:uncharacterized protein MYCFIDRAFT_175871 [Pseudocercospora fijiensis CIRAD86]|uniref:Uncharacterized protein n=1 Tax=Pseudocercospora fijiensis (strain CIRAD86) TaxID=383855 RepID=M3ACQ9_PSEFD|nr:uncharacterized protein MYCFIDRAFT_175871 [Pseudocercospora fijiensis CIRAD86]EME82331.1 hypothetical protein MYCFIDRAFT_175871 [Pseudocercospora fijiensis CIRAD86]
MWLFQVELFPHWYRVRLDQPMQECLSILPLSSYRSFYSLQAALMINGRSNSYAISSGASKISLRPGTVTFQNILCSSAVIHLDLKLNGRRGERKGGGRGEDDGRGVGALKDLGWRILSRLTTPSAPATHITTETSTRYHEKFGYKRSLADSTQSETTINPPTSPDS